MTINTTLVKRTFHTIVRGSRREILLDTFYNMLFERYPSVRPLFSETDITAQKAKLFTLLELVVRNLEKPERFAGAVEDLGVRHKDYGVKAEHYGPVVECMVLAIQEALGDDWNAEIGQEWTQAMETVADLMKQSAYPS